jgi:hypothetical protein
MLNQPATSPALIAIAVDAHAKAAKALEAAAKRVREHGAGPLADIYAMDLADIYAMDLDEAFACFELACDDLRETRDGYRYTYPHPVALVPHGRRYPVR